MIKAILSVDNKWGIGRNNDLLFHLPLDMKFFKDTTSGHVVALGENTLLSFPGGKPLKNRTHILIAKNDYDFDNVIVTHVWEDFLKTIKEYSSNEDVYIIGGASIYNQMLPYVDEVLLTKVYADGHATVFFDNLDENPNFEIIHSSEPVLDGEYEIEFVTYKNKSKRII